ncbi:MAG: DUF2510 domain-containing protein [Acidimicrobiales bacterium]
MSISPTNSPAGWYPDPGGERQWRVWTGTSWSELTRPYGERVSTPSLVDSLALISALNLLVRFGIVAVFSGLGLVVSVLAHWPGTRHPTPLWFAESASDLGLGLLVVGSVLFAFALRELVGRWTPLAFIPAVNIFAVEALVSQRLNARSASRRVLADVVLLALFIVEAHSAPWLAVALVVVALGQLQWTAALVDELCPPGEPVRAAP